MTLPTIYLFIQCYQIDFVIDIHAHTSVNGSFIYGNTYEDVYRYERHLVFPKLLSSNADDFAPENMMFNADDRKNGSARRFCCERLSDSVNSYTLEVSLGGFFLKGTDVVTTYTEEGCILFFWSNFLSLEILNFNQKYGNNLNSSIFPRYYP